MEITEQKLIEIIEKELDRKIQEIDVNEDIISALDLDSIEALRLLAVIEKTMEVRFLPEELLELRSIASIKEKLEEY